MNLVCHLIVKFRVLNEKVENLEKENLNSMKSLKTSLGVKLDWTKWLMVLAQIKTNKA